MACQLQHGRIAFALIFTSALWTGSATAGGLENDACAAAVEVLIGETEFDTTGATTDGPAHEGCQFDGQTYFDIWFDYIATATGDLTISTCNTASYDTDLVVYDGCTCPVTQERMIQCNDDTEGCETYTSVLEIPVVAGSCYKIRVGSYSADTVPAGGTLTLDLFVPFEACNGATGGCFDSVPDQLGCSDGACCQTVCNEDAFCCAFEWDQTCVDLAWQHCDPPTDRGACCVETECVGVTTEAECAGTWFQGANCDGVDCYAGVVDECPGGTVLPGDVVVGDTTSLTIDSDLPPCDTTVDAPGAWYHVTGTGHMMVATTCLEETDYDTKLNVFCAGCTTPVCVGGNDDGSPLGINPDPACVVPETGSDENRASTVRFCSAVGGEYYILVQGYAGNVGQFALELTEGDVCGGADPACVPLEGACCDGPTCVGNTMEDDCAGDWYAGMDCADFTCPFGACCALHDCVGTTAPSACEGAWHEGETCDSFDCPRPQPCTPCWSEEGIPDDIITRVAIANLDHESGEEGPPCQYSDFTDLVADVELGETYTLSVTVDPCHDNERCWVQHVHAWFDWNWDGVFDDDEVYDLGEANEETPTVTIDVTVPTDVPLLPTTMRISERYDGDPTPCEEYEFGATEDYTVLPHMPTGACCVDGVCTDAVVEADCSGTWHLGQACHPLLCAGLSHCAPCWGEEGVPDDIITNVTFNTINHTTGEEGTPCQHNQFFDVVTDVSPGYTYELSVTVDPCHDEDRCWPQWVRAWFDWNRDGVFDESEMHELGVTNDSIQTVSQLVTVPIDAALGATVMRVSERYEAYPEVCEVYDYGSTEDYAIVVAGWLAELADATPGEDQSLWRSANNQITLTFTGAVALPTPGALVIQAMLDDGQFGPDVSDGFLFAVDGASLTIRENGSVLDHGTWYAVRNVGAYTGVTEFAIHYLCQKGDANNDGRVLPNDLSVINANMPDFAAAPDSRFDINGDGRVLPADLSLCNSFLPSFSVPKPSGHE